MSYADTSVIIRAYFPDEPGHDHARRFVFDGEDAVVSSEVASVEFASAMWRGNRAGRIPNPAQYVQRFEKDVGLEGPLRLIALEVPRSLTAAKQLIARHPLKALDAIHLSVALDLPGEITFLTADRRQADAAVETGLAVELLG